MKLLIAFIGNAIALLVTANLVPGVTILDFRTLAIAAIVVGLVNTLIRPILRLISLPITLVTFGLFALVVNAATFGLAAWFVPGFEVDGIVPAFLGAIVLSIVSMIIDFFTDKMIGKDKKTESAPLPPSTE